MKIKSSSGNRDGRTGKRKDRKRHLRCLKCHSQSFSFEIKPFFLNIGHFLFGRMAAIKQSYCSVSTTARAVFPPLEQMVMAWMRQTSDCYMNAGI